MSLSEVSHQATERRPSTQPLGSSLVKKPKARFPPLVGVFFSAGSRPHNGCPSGFPFSCPLKKPSKSFPSQKKTGASPRSEIPRSERAIPLAPLQAFKANLAAQGISQGPKPRRGPGIPRAARPRGPPMGMAPGAFGQPYRGFALFFVCLFVFLRVVLKGSQKESREACLGVPYFERPPTCF